MNNKDFLLKALEAAQAQQGFCAPNPAVGAVLVQDGQVLAVGCHHGPGTPHAEVEAIRQVGSTRDLSRATLYVTLEPCCHHGRTPPCTELIIQRGIQTVVFAQLDPNPQVAGQGMQQLKGEGIDCQHQPIKKVTQFYRSYCCWWRTQLPWVTLKIAMSADGKIASADRKPVAITGQACNRFTHQQRLHSDVLLTTVETIIQDDPQLNVRLEDNTTAKPVAILDRRLRLPMSAKVLQSAERLIIFYSQRFADDKKLSALKEQGITCVVIEEKNEQLNLHDVLQCLGEQGYQKCWVEVGARCFQSFIKSKNVNECYIYIAPKTLGETAYGFAGFEYLQGLFNCEWMQLAGDAALRVYQK
ncbi:MAG: bifunctional diaminohydroxyphosphoribosylaminopyrimidine deaminase/5-amino-6-(5-phosphoribosylamino)uracil reductase RibD [Gammaproteobacteria bacterium]|nr:bifunctional diaminohydroxyphosphoribosylaminopyrimidine deaminase/5-amino-6-(5-phosphoribosylamino)uracil reductase RibD [Gammaproteobacteria bacterium]